MQPDEEKSKAETRPQTSADQSCPDDQPARSRDREAKPSCGQRHPGDVRPPPAPPQSSRNGRREKRGRRRRPPGRTRTAIPPPRPKPRSPPPWPEPSDRGIEAKGLEPKNPVTAHASRECWSERTAGVTMWRAAATGRAPEARGARRALPPRPVAPKLRARAASLRGGSRIGTLSPAPSAAKATRTLEYPAVTDAKWRSWSRLTRDGSRTFITPTPAPRRSVPANEGSAIQEVGPRCPAPGESWRRGSPSQVRAAANANGPVETDAKATTGSVVSRPSTPAEAPVSCRSSSTSGPSV